MEILTGEIFKIFADTGVIGMILFVTFGEIFIIISLIRLWKQFMEKDEKRDSAQIQISSHQTQVLSSQQSELQRLNTSLMEFLKERNQVLLAIAKTNKILADAIKELQNSVTRNNDKITQQIQNFRSDAFKDITEIKRAIEMVNRDEKIIKEILNMLNKIEVDQTQKSQKLISAIDELIYRISNLETLHKAILTEYKKLIERTDENDTRNSQPTAS